MKGDAVVPLHPLSSCLYAGGFLWFMDVACGHTPQKDVLIQGFF